MRNIKHTVSPDGKKLTLEIDLAAEGVVSASGLSNVIASTSGNVALPGGVGTLGLNFYLPIPGAKKARKGA